jgi:hypothetical protein
MDSLPSWASWIMTIGVLISPGIAFLSVRPIARLLHWLLWPRTEVAPQSRGKLACDETTAVSAPPR